MSKKRGEILWAAKLAGRHWAECEDSEQERVGDVSPRLRELLDELQELVEQPTYDEKRFRA